MENSKLYVIRGLPGSGKSTLAKNMFPNCIHIEADQFFERDGEYNFDISKLKDAHAWCQAETKKHLDSGHSVVVSNTFVRLWEMEFYLNLGYSYEVIEAKGKFKNIHDVPEHIINRMKNQWEEF